MELILLVLFRILGFDLTDCTANYNNNNNNSYLFSCDVYYLLITIFIKSNDYIKNLIKLSSAKNYLSL